MIIPNWQLFDEHLVDLRKLLPNKQFSAGRRTGKMKLIARIGVMPKSNFCWALCSVSSSIYWLKALRSGSCPEPLHNQLFWLALITASTDWRKQVKRKEDYLLCTRTKHINSDYIDLLDQPITLWILQAFKARQRERFLGILMDQEQG